MTPPECLKAQSVIFDIFDIVAYVMRHTKCEMCVLHTKNDFPLFIACVLYSFVVATDFRSAAVMVRGCQ